MTEFILILPGDIALKIACACCAPYNIRGVLAEYAQRDWKKFTPGEANEFAKLKKFNELVTERGEAFIKHVPARFWEKMPSHAN